MPSVCLWLSAVICSRKYSHKNLPSRCPNQITHVKLEFTIETDQATCLITPGENDTELNRCQHNSSQRYQPHTPRRRSCQCRHGEQGVFSNRIKRTQTSRIIKNNTKCRYYSIGKSVLKLMEEIKPSPLSFTKKKLKPLLSDEQESVGQVH